MADEIRSDTGDNADTSATGKGINQNRNQQRSDPQQNTYIGGSTSGEINQLWFKFYELAQLIREQAVATTSNTTRIEGLEVYIRRDGIVIRQIQPPESADLSKRTIFFMVFGAVLFIVVMMSILVYLVLIRHV